MGPKIAIILPTRGLVFTQVEQRIEEFRKDYEITVYRSHNLPIPSGHNNLTENALGDGNKYLFFIEEDTIPPARAIEKLLAADSGIACIDYGVSGWGCITKNKQGEILWCGLGCTLIKREVFEALEKPYFRTDKVLRLNDMTWQDLPQSYIENKNYGGLDIWFCSKAREKGFKVVQVEGEEADHLQLLNLGEKGKNHGLHEIGPKPKISKHQVI